MWNKSKTKKEVNEVQEDVDILILNWNLYEKLTRRPTLKKLVPNSKDQVTNH